MAGFRIAVIEGGLPKETPALTVNRLCGSGLQAIVSAAQSIQLGDTDAAVAGGAESMSRAQYWMDRGAQPSDTVRSLIKKNKKQAANEPVTAPLPPEPTAAL